MSPAWRQLYCLTARDFAAPFYVGEDNLLRTRGAHNIPLLIWPDGRWCGCANRFMRECFERGLSRRHRGGSLATYAAHLSHLLRYCYARQIIVEDLTDNRFSEFIDSLKPVPGVRSPRESSSVIAIGQTCLALLVSVGRHRGEEAFVGLDGRIKAYRRPSPLRHHAGTMRARGRRQRKDETKPTDDQWGTWWHHSFPTPSPKSRRRPVATGSIEAMREAIPAASSTIHIKLRRFVLLRLLEATGGRRLEIAALTVRSVLDASQMQKPMLRMTLVKKRSGAVDERLVPISRSDLLLLIEYVQVHRRTVLRRTLGASPDHGLLLVSDRTGKPLDAGTLTDEIDLIAKAAGLAAKVSPHLFRHRFITKLFVALIEHHEARNVDQFRRLLLSTSTLKQKVAEMTGHSSLESLDIYIDLAFEEVGDLESTMRKVDASRTLESLSAALHHLMIQIKEGKPDLASTEQMLQQLEELRSKMTQSP